ncbi:MAG: DNA-binding protein [Sphaerochaetaceae bacterium]|jgi:predicted DNA-binding protein with PD1-like motif|nr:DNA-binding protein [Sphaerochaetaceae bacterium]
MRTICIRLTRGADLKQSIVQVAKDHDIKAAVVLSAVGCLSKAIVRDAGGIDLRSVEEPCEIISLMGTVSALRTHLHIGLAKQSLEAIGGHLVEGCIVNTTCELVLGILDGWEYGVCQDEETGYDEIIFNKA